MNKLNTIFFCLLLIFGLLLRLYHLNYPIADWHSHRQADTASVSRNLQNKIGTFMVPTYHDLSDVQSGQDNPKGYRMVELPIYNQISATFSQIAHIPIEMSSRLINIFFSLVTATILYLLTNTLYAPAIFLLLPYSIYYSRSVLPESLAVLFLTVSLFFLQKKSIILFSIFLGLGLLVKPFVGLILLPIFVVHFIKFSNQQKVVITIFSLIFGILPFLLWRQHIQNYSAGIPAFKWLFQQGFSGESFVVGRPYWFRWLFWERISLLILGIPLIFPLIISMFKKTNLPYFLGILLYFSIIARGNVQHDYYQVLILPFLAILVSGSLQKIPRVISLLLILSSLYLTFPKILPYYKINHPQIIYAGWKTDSLTPKDSLIIAPYTGDTALLYQTNRSGWPTEVYDIPKITQATNFPVYLVSVNFDTYTRSLQKKYQTVYIDSNMILLNLRKPLHE